MLYLHKKIETESLYEREFNLHNVKATFVLNSATVFTIAVWIFCIYRKDNARSLESMSEELIS